MKKIKIFFLLFILIILFTFTQVYSYTNIMLEKLQSDILRLHIIGNSNLSSDQLFKLKCRDNIISYINSNISPTSTKSEIMNFISNNINEIYTICYDTAEKENINTTFNIELTNSYFPTKYYGNITMPKGYYDCLKIEIGSSNGNNWWCSLFPPLCFSEVSVNLKDSKSSESIITNTLSSEESDLLLNSNSKPDIKLKFKLLEVLSQEIK